jgi:hypothetical protein
MLGIVAATIYPPNHRVAARHNQPLLAPSSQRANSAIGNHFATAYATKVGFV